MLLCALTWVESPPPASTRPRNAGHLVGATRPPHGARPPSHCSRARWKGRARCRGCGLSCAHSVCTLIAGAAPAAEAENRRRAFEASTSRVTASPTPARVRCAGAANAPAGAPAASAASARCGSSLREGRDAGAAMGRRVAWGVRGSFLQKAPIQGMTTLAPHRHRKAEQRARAAPALKQAQ